MCVGPKPWISGPKELLDHAAGHLAEGSDFDKRIAFISIDNAVELLIRTFLELPRRARGSDGPSRKQLQDATGSFPGHLDLVEEYAADRLEGVELGDLEWYHRIRNMLYHEGSGVTVESAKATAYLELAKLLLKNLFGEQIDTAEAPSESTAIGRFMLRWAQVEHNLGVLAQGLDVVPDHGSLERITGAHSAGLIPTPLAKRLHELRQVRNTIVHGHSVPLPEVLEPLVDELLEIAIDLSRRAT